MDIPNLWDKAGRAMKRRSVVLTSRKPLKLDAVLNYFSKTNNPLRDCRWKEGDNYYIVILQFQNEDGVNRIFHGSQVLIDGNLIQIKKAADMRMKNWTDMFYESRQRKWNVVGMNSVVRNPAYNGGRQVLGKFTGISFHTPPPPQPLPEAYAPYAALCEDVQISKQELQAVYDLLNRLDNVKLIGNYWIGARRSPKATLFRHWYLGLRNAGSNQLLIYVRDKKFRGPQICRIDFASSSIKRLCLNVVEAGLSFQDEKSGIIFGLVTRAKEHQPEVFTCKLAQYLVRFDPRAKSLLTLIHFWARENDVNLAEDETQEAIPDPAALEWLCLFFLSRKEIIPTPLEVIDRSENGELVGFPDSPASFRMDEDFVQEWKQRMEKNLPQEGTEEFVKKVLELTCAFFQLYTENTFEGTILKTREAKVVSAVDILSDSVKNGAKCDRMCLMQPLYSDRSFSLSQEKFNRVVPIMKETSETIENYLSNIQKQQEHLNVDLKTLFQSSLRQIFYLDASRVERHEVVDADEKRFATACSNESILSYLFTLIRKQVLMSEIEQQNLANCHEMVHALFERTEFPGCEVIQFRNQHLKLKHFGSYNLVFFFVKHLDFQPKASSETDWEELTRRIKRGNYKDEVEGSLLAFMEAVGQTRKNLGESEYLQTFFDTRSDLHFRIVPHCYLQEVQTSRLVEYFCGLDRRVMPLMTVIFYWANMNVIQLGNGKCGSSAKVGLAPNPTLMEWLVLYFLKIKGVVPSPEELMEKVELNGVNLDFKHNEKLAQEWQAHYNPVDEEEHLLNVFKLARGFFRFWSECGNRAQITPLIVDLQRCHTFEKFLLMDNQAGHRAVSSATGLSVKTLRKLRSEPLIEQAVYCQEERITFLHPLHVNLGFSFDSKAFVETVCAKMSVTKKKLRELLIFLKSKQGGDGVKAVAKKLSFAIETVLRV